MVEWMTMIHGNPSEVSVLPAFQAGRQVPVFVSNGEDLMVLEGSTGTILLRMASMHGFSSVPGVWETSLFAISNEGFLYRLDYFR